MDGWQETTIFQAPDGTIVVNTYQDVEPIIDANKRAQNDSQCSDWGRAIAEIPNNIAYRWLKEEWDRGNKNLRYLSPEWRALVRRKLRDPDWRWMRADNSANPFFMGWRK